uniref:Putative secreted protein n=1 Tax=Ixodes ricinus TaxID=34613 RepID=A0A6B0U7T8_IXORI
MGTTTFSSSLRRTFLSFLLSSCTQPSLLSSAVKGAAASAGAFSFSPAFFPFAAGRFSGCVTFLDGC